MQMTRQGMGPLGHGRLWLTVKPLHLPIPLLALHRPPTLVERLQYILDGYPRTDPQLEPPTPQSREGTETRPRRRRRRQQHRSPAHTPPLSPTPHLPHRSLLVRSRETGEEEEEEEEDPPISQWELPPSQRLLSQLHRGPSPVCLSPRGSDHGDGRLTSHLCDGSPPHRRGNVSPRSTPDWFPFVDDQGHPPTPRRADSPHPLQSRSPSPDQWVPLPRPAEAYRRRQRPRLQKQHENLRGAIHQLERDAWQLQEDVLTDLGTFFGKLGIYPRRL
nr:early protein 4 [Canis familiaris papillomavirus type 25]